MPIAGEFTAKQAKLVETIALGGSMTVTEAARKAGMSRENASRALSRNVTLQNAIVEKRRAKSVTARAIRGLSLEKASENLEKIDDSESAMRVAVMAATVEEKVGDSDDAAAEPPEESRRRLRLIMLRAVRRALSSLATDPARLEGAIAAVNARLAALGSVQLGDKR